MFCVSTLLGVVLVASSQSAADLLIDVRDVSGRTITDQVVVTARAESPSAYRLRYTISFAGHPVILRLADAPTGLAIVTLAPSAYEPHTATLRLEPGRTIRLTATVTIRSSEAYAHLPRIKEIESSARWAELSRVLINSGIHEKDWNGISTQRRAGLLNIYAKLDREMVDARPIVMFVRRITMIRPERIFAEVDPRLLELVRNAPDRFHAVSPALHGAPDWTMVGHDGSFKTCDEQGNLQLTFAYDAAGRLVADIDIDDHSGLRHWWDVVKHIVTRTETDPFEIHEILIRTQRLDPGYALFPRSGGPDATAAR